MGSDPTFKQAYATALADQALLSVARQPLVEMIARRSISGQQTQTLMEAFESQACQRLFDNGWQCNMQIAYYTALNKPNTNNPSCSPQNVPDKSKQPDLVGAATIDMTVQMATSTCLEFEKFKQNEVIQALLAAQISQQYRQAQNAAAIVSTAQPNVSAVTQNPSGGSSGGTIASPSGGSTTGTAPPTNYGTSNPANYSTGGGTTTGGTGGTGTTGTGGTTGTTIPVNPYTPPTPAPGP